MVLNEKGLIEKSLCCFKYFTLVNIKIKKFEALRVRRKLTQKSH